MAGSGTGAVAAGPPERGDPVDFGGRLCAGAPPLQPPSDPGPGVRYKEDFEAVRRLWSLPPLTETVSRVTLFHSTRVAGQLSYLPLASAPLEPSAR